MKKCKCGEYILDSEQICLNCREKRKNLKTVFEFLKERENVSYRGKPIKIKSRFTKKD